MIEKALRAANEQQEEVVRDVFRKAGLLWQCKSLTCRFDNTPAHELCEGCGRQRDGRRVGDRVPPSAHPDDFEDLRALLKEHFAYQGKRLPDAVTFEKDFGNEWLSYGATLHYGPRTRFHDFGSDVEEALCDLGRAEPGEHLRVALSR
ncbi:MULTISPECIES: hypothetical protein [Streptomyces]|uniref:RanBP2-type domain-containing protein n=1 Tax=Streptomyces griseiscabiei TaxID=2993540 RepID=A0ABU4LDK4_9ACTN|nr:MULTISPECIES: hypothetical protein [Streptomyces]MBZ3908331.1 hypothetical protein [Streptomyces griseiscabiei]MDX2913844.1 hypothetical protein [Streptomyces griseiscabiei]